MEREEELMPEEQGVHAFAENNTHRVIILNRNVMGGAMTESTY